jgi:flagellar biosynthesis/type III secretory pathway chaperone
MNSNLQNSPEPWEPLAAAFREELSECAHLLVLLEEQQNAMLERRFVDVGEHDNEISIQLQRLQLLRSNSQALYAEFSDGGDLARDKEHWDRFLAELPMGARELFRALRQEMRQQFRRLQRFSQENLALLTSAREAYGELLRRVVPTTERPAYDATGRSRNGFRLGPRSFASLA